MALSDTQILVQNVLLRERAAVAAQLATLSAPAYVSAQIAALTKKLSEIDSLIADIDPALKKGAGVPVSSK